MVRESEDTFGSISAAVNFCRRCAGKVSGAGFWFGAMHLVAFVVASTVVMYPLSLANLVPASVTLSLMGMVTLAYFAVADYLHVARLAGYVSLVEWDRSPRPIVEPIGEIVTPVLETVAPALSVVSASEPAAIVVSGGEAVVAGVATAEESVGLEPTSSVRSDSSLGPNTASSNQSSNQEDEPFFSLPGAQASGPDDSPVSGFAPGEPLRPK